MSTVLQNYYRTRDLFVNPNIQYAYGRSQSEYDQYFQREEAGFRELAALNASKFIGGARAQDERNELLEGFRADTQAFEAMLMQQEQAQNQFSADLTNLNARMANVRAGAATAPSKASSVRQFQQLAKQNMQGTARYLAELEGYSMPQAPEIDFSFENPITGERIAYGTSFEDIYSGGFDPREEARRTIVDTFEETKQRQLTEFQDALRTEYGVMEDYTQEFEDRRDENGKIRAYNPSGMTQFFDDAVAAAEYELSGKDYWRWDKEYYERFRALRDGQRDAERYAEAMTLAEMGAIDGATTRGVGGMKTATGASFFYGSDTDVNAVLDSMVDATADRLEVARLSQETDFRAEFERRSARAAQQQALYDSQLQANQAAEQQIANEKRQVQSLLEQQKREYAEALGGFGSYSTVDGQSGITFSDTRPM